MSRDSPSLQTTQKREPQNGPPFNPNAANDGASVDPGTGKIIWGNAVGAAGNPAKLLQNHEIMLQAFLFFFNNGQLAPNLNFNNLAFYVQGSWITGRAVLTDQSDLVLDAFGDSNGVLVGFRPSR
jgi:hypothetical protein